MVRRIEGNETNVPWYLENKIECYKFCTENGFPTADVIRIFDHPNDIDLSGMDSEFVLKPSSQSSMKGVMVLKPVDGRFYDFLQNKILALEEIINCQRNIYQETTAVGNKIIIEQKLCDINGHNIPRDFKAYAFRGEIALFLENDRNTTPPSVAFFDGNFEALKDKKVKVNPKYITKLEPRRPTEANDLLGLAKQVSKKLPTPFARVDLYSTDEGPKVGEVTLTPGGFYYGVHYTLSDEEQTRLGAMWLLATRELK